jgi:geranylgeranyl pyrophosphate synthase
VTQLQLKQLYGPVAEDLILVEDLLESTKSTEISALKRMLDHALQGKGKRMRPALVLLAGAFGNYDPTGWCHWERPSNCSTQPALSTTTSSMALSAAGDGRRPTLSSTTP